jgi:hypothetical protein
MEGAWIWTLCCCRKGGSCRGRLERYEQACAVDAKTKTCAGAYEGCRSAMLDILGKSNFTFVEILIIGPHHRVHTYIGRDKTLFLPTQLERTLQLVMVNVVKGGGRAPPTLTSLGKFYPHDGMHATKRPLPLCVICRSHPEII